MAQIVRHCPDCGWDHPFEQFHGQRVEQELLDGAFEWAGAELRIITLLRQIMCGLGNLTSEQDT